MNQGSSKRAGTGTRGVITRRVQIPAGIDPYPPDRVYPPSTRVIDESRHPRAVTKAELGDQ